MKKVILVSGKLRSGKNQFATYLDQHYQLHNYTVRQDLFAKTLKDWCKDDLQPVCEHINGEIENVMSSLIKHKNYLIDRYPSHAKHVGKPFQKILDKLLKLITKPENFYEEKTDISRIMLQRYGTEIFRDKIDNDFWVKKVIEHIKESSEEVTIITDVRFPNEIEMLEDEKEFNVVTIRIERDIERNTEFSEHPSETALDKFDRFHYIVDNNGSLEDLWNSMDVIFEELENEKEEKKNS